jgi:hypothetical protein
MAEHHHTQCHEERASEQGLHILVRPVALR